LIITKIGGAQVLIKFNSHQHHKFLENTPHHAKGNHPSHPDKVLSIQAISLEKLFRMVLEI